jgi:hypothetical protein
MRIASFDGFASAPMPSLAIQGLLRKLFKLNFMEVAAVRQATTWISEWELTAQSFDELNEQFKQVMWQIYCYAMKQKTEWDVLIFKTLGMALGNCLASKLPLAREHMVQLRELRQPVQRRPGAEDFAVSYREFINSAAGIYKARFNTAHMLMLLKDDDLSYLDDFYRHDMDEAIQSLLAGITQLAKYGVKSCMMRDNLLHPVDYAWVMNDGRDIFSHLVPDGIDMELMDPPFALTILAKQSGVRTSKPTKSIEKMGMTATRQLSFDFGSTILTSADLYSDGRVTLDTGFGMVPIRSVFEELKATDLYKPFHLLQLMRIYDLVVPVERAKSYGVPVLPIRRRRPDATEKFELTWRQLVVPRIRLVDDPGLVMALEQEVAQDLAFTNEYAGTRESREITGFLRRLRRGQASDTARKLAIKERGWLNLPEGYTYVKNHTWGTGPNQTAGHVAVRRPSA